MKLVTVDEMRHIEHQAIEAGLTEPQMMENAGSGLAAWVDNAYRHIEHKTALGLIGPGNNGGDTLIALNHLATKGWTSIAYFVRSRPADQVLAEQLARNHGILIDSSTDDDFIELQNLLDQAGILMDGILGTGIRLPLRGDISNILAYVRENRKPDTVIVAVDCPTGIDCDTGAADPNTLAATNTICMAAVKTGLIQPPANQLVGTLQVVDIGIPAHLPAWSAIQDHVLDASSIVDLLPDRPADAHKGTFGTALLLAGSTSFTGAAYLAGKAAYLVGAGLVTLAVPAPLHPALAGQIPEATWLLLPDENGFIASTASQIVLASLDRVTALLIGPGIGLLETTRGCLAEIISHDNLPKIHGLVIDADGLKHLRTINGWPKQIPGDTILTPHPGEMSVLTGLPVNQIQANRVEIARQSAKEWGCIVILKGAYTVIANQHGNVAVVPVATPALARAGSGDVLAGMVTGLRAQGLNAFQAACAGAWMHARAGQLAADQVGHTASVLAGDIIIAIPDVFVELFETKRMDYS